MINSSKWRLVSEVDAFVYKDEVWLASCGKKTYRGNIISGMSNKKQTYTEVHLDSNEFKICIKKDGLYVSNESFPDSTKFYYVSNLGDNNILEIVSQVEINKGGTSSDVFEVSICTDYPSKIKLFSEGMTEYDEAFDEMTRVLSSQINSKTKKWIPGHRYDSENETLFCLGSFYSRKANATNTDFLEDSAMQPVFLVTNRIPEGVKKISEILKTIPIDAENGLKVVYEPTQMADNGEVLENDLKTVTRDDMISAAKNAVQCYNVLELQTNKEAFKVPSDNSLSIIKTKTREELEKTWATYAGLEIGNERVNSADPLLERFFADLDDTNIFGKQYYQQLFLEIGIDLKLLAEEVIDDLGEDDFMKFISSYIKYGELYYKLHKPSESRPWCDLRKNTRPSYIDKRITLKDRFGDKSYLASKIKELAENARGNFGEGVSTYEITNLGTKRSPKNSVVMKISAKDLVDAFPGDSALEEEIINAGLWEINIEFDEEGEALE